MDTLETDIEVLESAVRLFFQTMKRPQNWARVTKRAGVNVDRPAAVLLHAVMANQTERCHVHDLAMQLGIEAPSVTRKTQELEQDGYLRRVPDPLDRRAIGFRVTPRGRAASKRLWNAQREIIAQAVSQWDPSERQQFIELFKRFSDDLATASTGEKRPISERGL